MNVIRCAVVPRGVVPGFISTVAAADIRTPKETVEKPVKPARVLVAVLFAAATTAAANSPSSVVPNDSDSTLILLVREKPNS